MFVNLTPHAIVLNSGTTFAPSGKVARVSSSHTTFDSDGICSVTFGDVTDLPDPVPGTFYIVSALVAAAAKRADVVSPASGHPDVVRSNGQIVSVPGFVQAV